MKAHPPLPLIGWREWVTFPDFADVRIKAKIDTGARSSSLHAEEITFITLRRRDYVQFELFPDQKTRRGHQLVCAPLVDVRRVRSSNGQVEKRPVIIAPVVVCGEHFDTEVTLTGRDLMGFRMLLGRQALHKRFLVDVRQSFLGGKPARRTRK